MIIFKLLFFFLVKISRFFILFVVCIFIFIVLFLVNVLQLSLFSCFTFLFTKRWEYFSDQVQRWLEELPIGWRDFGLRVSVHTIRSWTIFGRRKQTPPANQNDQQSRRWWPCADWNHWHCSCSADNAGVSTANAGRARIVDVGQLTILRRCCTVETSDNSLWLISWGAVRYWATASRTIAARSSRRDRAGKDVRKCKRTA